MPAVGEDQYPGDSTAGGLKLQRHRVGGITTAIQLRRRWPPSVPARRCQGPNRPTPSLTVGRYGLINRGETCPRVVMRKRPSLILNPAAAFSRFRLGALSFAGILSPSFLVLETMGENDVATGTVKWFNSTKGYGFIQPDTGGKDVFVHISAVEKAGFSSLAEGAKVSYEIVSDRGKESAGNLRL
jgi:cold shock protein